MLLHIWPIEIEAIKYAYYDLQADIIYLFQNNLSIGSFDLSTLFFFLRLFSTNKIFILDYAIETLFCLSYEIKKSLIEQWQAGNDNQKCEYLHA